MGCDIHAMMEWRKADGWWLNGGDPDLGRDYELFSVLADVRNYDGIPFIQRERGLPDDVSDEFRAYSEWMAEDGHSHGYVTLAEVKAYDTDQEFNDRHLVLARDDNGRIISTCLATTGAHLGPVGRRKIFGLWGMDTWQTLIAKMEALPGESDDDKRLVFMFDS